jgi:ribosomal protein L37AE/L43A
MKQPKHTRPSVPVCSVCDSPREFDDESGLWVCPKCQAARDCAEVTYFGVKVDST